MSHEAINSALKLIFLGITQLKDAFPSRAFTIDGRLVGDIGEVIAEIEYDLVLDKISRRGYDATTVDGRRVQIKATFKDHLTFRTVPDYYLGFKLNDDGTYEEIFNGPGSLIHERYEHRSGIGENLLSFPLSVMRELSATVPPDQRIRKRKG